MDSCGDEISRSSASSDDSGEGCSLSAASTAEGNTRGVSEDSKCRKSSRLRAKMDKQAQDAGQDGNSDAYNLRLSSLVKRVQVERNRSTPKQPKGKSKPPPLSKYRRRTANARERQRMQEINEGYENLRQCLPDMEAQSTGKKKEKPTKFTILSLAINYIHALRDTLGYPPLHSSESSSSSSSPVGSSLSSEGKSTTSDDNNNNCTTTSTVTSNDTPAILSCSEDSNGGSDPACARMNSVSSGDEVCSNPSPVAELKDCPAVDCAPLYVPSMLHADFAVSAKHLTRCHDPLPGSAIMMEFREEARSSPSSSNHSLSPSPPPLPLPEDCMDLEESDLLNVSISLPAFDGMEDIVM